MSKKVKMLLYGEPGVGKSTFASKAPKPLFICSDGNYEWLDMPEEDGIEVQSWSDCKKILGNKDLLSKYETIVLDLTEDFFKFCEYEYCKKNSLEHISDQGYGKGYDATRNEFFIEICKLIALDKHVILITHGITITEKDRKGVEHTKYRPSSRIPDKVLDMIEGRVRYCLRCYLQDEEESDGKVIKKRYLSIVPKPNEFGIARGLDEANCPSDIDLDWNKFSDAIGLNNSIEEHEKKINKNSLSSNNKEIKENTGTISNEQEIQVVSPAVSPIEVKELSNADKLAAIKAKLANMNRGE